MTFVEVVLLIVLNAACMGWAFTVGQDKVLAELQQLRDETYIVDVEGGDPPSPE